MKNLFSLLALSLLFVSCKKDGGTAVVNNAPLKSTASFAASTDQDTAKYEPIYIHDIPSPENLNTFKTGAGEFGPVLVPDLSRSESQILIKSYWVFEFYVDDQASLEQRKAGSGQWLQFNADGTFRGGHWNQQTHAGVWHINFGETYPRLWLDSNVDKQDAVWELQRVSGDQTEMGWRRVNDSGVGPYRRSIMCKMMNMMDMPTKQQFAGQFNGL